MLEQHPDVKVVCHDRMILNNSRIAYVSSSDLKEIGRTQAQFLLNHFHSTGAASMTIDKNLRDMAYNTAMIVNGLISNSPVRTSQSISGIPAIYSKITVMTKDSY